MSQKQPAFQFYPGDWMKDPNLRRCSRAARGMWIDMLCLMFECEERGVLSSGGTPWTNQEIAAAVGGDVPDGIECVEELLRKGVAHRNQSGAILCKRMVRDEQIRRARSAAGKLGGNPDLLKQKSKQTASKPQANRKQNPTPSSSSSSSSEEGEKKTPSESPHSRAVAFFCDSWQSKYGERYPFAGGKDGEAVKAILAHLGGDLDKFAAVVGRYLADGDPFLNGHTLGVLRSQLAKWLTDRPVRGPAGGLFDRGAASEQRILSTIVEALNSP